MMDTILLIENDPTNLLALSLAVRCFGYTVLEASDRGEAWSYSREHSGTIRLIMMEVSLNPFFRDHSGPTLWLMR